MASENDVILLSCLSKAPGTAEATAAVCAALQRVIVRGPSAKIHDAGPGTARAGVSTVAGAASVAAAGTTGTAPHLRAICPFAHKAVVDGKLLRAFLVTRARIILAGLTPLPDAISERLPTVVAGIADGPAGLCFLGQRTSSDGYSAFSLRRKTEFEGAREGAEQGERTRGHDAIRIDDLMYEYGGRAQASVRALYDLWGKSNGDVLGGSLQEDFKSHPFARLATEWDCSNHATRTLGSGPPPACSSLLFVGGACPPSATSLALRKEITNLSTAAGETASKDGVPSQARPNGSGPFLASRNAGNSAPVAAVDVGEGSGFDAAALERQKRARWDEDLQRLLSGSENMADLASRTHRERSGDSSGEGQSDSDNGEEEDDTAVPKRNNGGEMEEEGTAGGHQSQWEKFRSDLDFSERLWELMARAADVEGVRSAMTLAFDAVGEGHIFPVVSRDNQTAIARHIRDGVSMAREARYHDSGTAGIGLMRDEAKSETWRKSGSSMMADTESLAHVFVELGVHKVKHDLLYWLEVHAGVLAADVHRALPSASATANDTPLGDDAEEQATTLQVDRRLKNLMVLAETLDLVTLARSYGAPWRQVRALALSGLATLGTPAASPSLELPVFPLVLPKPIPPYARARLSHPIFWELFLEPIGARGQGVTSSLIGGGRETVSYVMATASIFQPKGMTEPPTMSGGAARAAQAALEGCPPRLIPEVLSSVAGVESLSELRRRQLERRGKGAADEHDVSAVFLCEHRFTPW